jgi:hypothetical protein
VLVSDRDQVVAELGPPRQERARRLPDAMLADLIRRGLLTPALEASGRPPRAARAGTLSEILAELDDDRSR